MMYKFLQETYFPEISYPLLQQTKIIVTFLLCLKQENKPLIILLHNYWQIVLKEINFYNTNEIL